MEKVILFYKYVSLEFPVQIQKWQRRLCTELGLTGRIILAAEGINGTLAGSNTALEQYKKAMLDHPLFTEIDFKESPGSIHNFPRLFISIKEEIVKLGIPSQKIRAVDGGRHLTPAQAHALLKQNPHDLVLLDGRNNYESRIGTFAGAITPPIENFRELPEYIDNNSELFKDKTVLMFCTGGIRCERASAYLKQKNVAREVLQISGGIHRYVEQFPQGYFKGKNYVFDGRVALTVTDDILTNCDNCAQPYDAYENCINAQCNKQIILCPACLPQRKSSCSNTCLALVESGTVTKRTISKRTVISQQR